MSNENRNATTKIGQLLQLSQAEHKLEHSRLMHCKAHAVSSELQVLQALTRRALAADQAGLISFRTLDAIHQDFMGRLSRPAPPGFEPPCIAAVMRTDQELWKLVSDEVGSKIQQESLGLKPLDAAFTRLSSAATVALHLLPTCKPAGGPADRKERRKFEDADSCSPDHRAGKTGVRSRKRQAACLKIWRGLPSQDKHGVPFCYNFNLAHGCWEEASGEPCRCKRGLHACMGCGKHGQHVCRS